MGKIKLLLDQFNKSLDIISWLIVEYGCKPNHYDRDYEIGYMYAEGESKGYGYTLVKHHDTFSVTIHENIDGEYSDDLFEVSMPSIYMSEKYKEIFYGLVDRITVSDKLEGNVISNENYLRKIIKDIEEK